MATDSGFKTMDSKASSLAPDPTWSDQTARGLAPDLQKQTEGELPMTGDARSADPGVISTKDHGEEAKAEALANKPITTDTAPAPTPIEATPVEEPEPPKKPTAEERESTSSDDLHKRLAYIEYRLDNM